MKTSTASIRVLMTLLLATACSDSQVPAENVQIDGTPSEAQVVVPQALSQRQSTLSNCGFADSMSSGGGLSSRACDSTRSSGSFDSNRRSELNRNYNARTNGYDRFNSRQSNAVGNRQGGRQI